LKHYCSAQNIRVVELASGYTASAMAQRNVNVPASFKAPRTEDLEAWAADENISLDPSDTFVLSESDCGAEDAERIAAALGLRGNGPSPHLRNKYLANEVLRERGVPAVQQALVGSVEELDDFLLRRLWPSQGGGETYCVVKPYRGVASDGVFLCASLEEARHAFAKLHQQPRFGGGVNDKVLVQQYVVGTEYAVDTVASDGRIKVAALWRYRKLPANGAPFVYQCSELVAAEGAEAEAVCDYCVELLQALGLRWGPTHTEIKATPDGPRLIEVNAGRFHAQHFQPIVRRCLGYDALAATLDGFFAPGAFDMLPDRPDRLMSHGLILHLINSRQGTVRAVRHEEEIRALPSVIGLHLEAGVGEQIARTVDIRTDSGYALLVHDDDAVVQTDFDRIVQLQSTIFDVDDAGNAPAGAAGVLPSSQHAQQPKGAAAAAADAGIKMAGAVGQQLRRILSSPFGAKVLRIALRVPALVAAYLAIAYAFGLLLPIALGY
jgi:biotin carboxylase